MPARGRRLIQVPAQAARQVISVLSPGGSYHAIVPDHPGFGRSGKPADPEPYRIPCHVARLDARLESLDLRDALVVV